MLQARQHGQKEFYRLVRPRTVLYAAIIAIVGAIMAYTLATRHYDGISVIHDRNPLFVRLSDGALRNGYEIQILNKTQRPRSYELKVDGLQDAEISVIGSEGSFGGSPLIYVGADQSREIRVLITTHQKIQSEFPLPFTFTITPASGGSAVSAVDHFAGP